MKALVLLGSPRPQGNTAALTAILCDQLQQGGVQTEVLSLYEKEILPCVACRGCQQDWSAFACVRKDDVASIAEKILDCDLMVLALRRWKKRKRSPEQHQACGKHCFRVW